MKILHLTDETFDEEVLNSDKPVLIDFWAEWCGPCRMLAPTIEELANEVTDAKICKVDVDECIELATHYRVMSIPFIAVFKNGEMVDKAIGVQPKEKLIEMINNAK